MNNPARQQTQTGPAAGLTNATAVAIVSRQFRKGLSGFYIFIACIALGVAAIAAVGALGDMLGAGLENQGSDLLGGDLRLSRVHMRATEGERAILTPLGRVSETASMRSSAKLPDNSDQTLVELKGVDAAYPLTGILKLAQPSQQQTPRDDGSHVTQFQAAVHQADTAIVERLLLERLGLAIGDTFKVGSHSLHIAGIIEHAPDALTDRISYGPKVYVSLDTLEKTGLLGPGALVRWRYALALEPSNAAQSLDAARAALQTKLAGSGFEIFDKRNPSPQLRRLLNRLRQFLTLVGLTALLIGGVGVANAVATFIDKNRKTIATLKSVGATESDIFKLFLLQVAFVTAIGVAIGLIFGLTAPHILAGLVQNYLPIALAPKFSISTAAAAASYGFLVAALFSLWPLGRAASIRPAVLFRDEVARTNGWPAARIVIATLVLAALLAGVAITGSDARHVAVYYCLCVALVFALFYGLGIAVERFARNAPRPGTITATIALRSLAAPGGLTRSIVLSLGTSLSVLVAVAVAQASMSAELRASLPANSPDYFVLDIPREEISTFERIVDEREPDADIRTAPMLRGRLVELAGNKVENIDAPHDAKWVLRGDRGITYASAPPKGSTITKGAWWPAGYDGPPLVSFDHEIGEKLGLKLGDTVTVNVLGRDITARIANFRKIEWRSLAINFIMVFSPNTLEGAPANILATIKFPPTAELTSQASISRELSQALPSISMVRVKEAIDAFDKIMARILNAVHAAGALTFLSGALVVAGALTTARHRRVRDAVILSTLGATRTRIIAAHITEYAILSLITAVFAIVAGTIAGSVFVSQVMDLAPAVSFSATAGVLALALGLVVLFGVAGTWATLSARPVSVLRAD